MPLEGVPAVQLDEGPRSDVKRQDAPEQDTPPVPLQMPWGVTPEQEPSGQPLLTSLFLSSPAKERSPGA